MSRRKKSDLVRAGDGSQLFGISGGEVTEAEAVSDIVRVEKDIITLGFFTPTSKGRTSKLKSTRVKVVRLTSTDREGRTVETTVKINTGGEYGLPGTRDLDMWLAFMKIVNGIQRREGLVENPIRFTSWELFNLLGYRSDSSKNFGAITEWLNRMYATTVECWVSGGAGVGEGTGIRNLSVFKDRVSKGERLPGGQIADRNYVWLNDWQLANINNNFVIPVDFVTYRRLKSPIAKALVPLLQVYLFTTRSRNLFEKNYAALCQLLGIKQWKYAGDIVDQLGPALNDLQTHGYLAGWGVEPMRGGGGFKVVFRHGDKFRRDLGQTSGPQEPAAQLPPASEGEVRAVWIGELAARGVDETVARDLVAKIPTTRQILDELDYIDHKLASWKGGAPKNPPGYIVSQLRKGVTIPADFVTRAMRRAREEAERAGREEAARVKAEGEKRERLQSEYKEYCGEEAESYIASLTKGEEELLKVQAKAAVLDAQPLLANLPGRALELFIADEMKAIVVPLLGLMTFEEFCAERGEAAA